VSEAKAKTDRQDLDHFREYLPTVDQRGNRVWIYPARPPGPGRGSPEAFNWYRARILVSLVLLAIMILGPFIRINGNPLLMMNIIERKFSVFGVMFWPDDLYIFALFMITGFLALVIFTTAFGRIWCGWLCPQTVMMEMVFRQIEYWIEGDAPNQKRLDHAPWSAGKLFRKVLKHGLFFALSFVVGNLLLSYIIGSEALLDIITDNPKNHLTGLGFMLAFTFLFYSIFARFREQACTFICPYGRFQSALLDENSLVVAYDYTRGENRKHLSGKENQEERRAAGFGDCIDCGYCRAVCPTGIDIRNGSQMECVNCTACIDACNMIMHKTGNKPGLIRYASLDGIKLGKPIRFTARMKAYSVLLVILICALTGILMVREPVTATILRSPGSLYQELQNGEVANLFTVRLTNKTREPRRIHCDLLAPEGTAVFPGDAIVVPPHGQAQGALLIQLSKEALTGKITHTKVGIFEEDRLLDVQTLSFTGPDDFRLKGQKNK
jgi:cytochrome c oxidase accessory protein FixG